MQPELNKETLKIPTKLYRIGELVDYTPFSRQTIHNYTIMGLIREAKWTEGGHRLYDESVFERLSEIIRLRKTKTLSEIRETLSKKYRRDSQTIKTDENGRIEHESDVTTNG
jgi:DNA-binding transcriptional MerR regulator